MTLNVSNLAPGGINNLTVFPWFDGFESGLDDWTVNDLSVATDRVYEGSNSAYSANAQTNQPQAYVEFDDVGVGARRIESVEWYWQETSGSKGGGLRILNSDGNVECGFATDNPEWYVFDADNDTARVDGGTGYDLWVYTRLWFDWENSEFCLRVKDIDGGGGGHSSKHGLAHGVDAARINIDCFHTGGGGWQGGDGIEMWFDSLLVEF